ncbi:hypothetical protein NA57DRAFT_40833 [Rhizodiscina lignyota]|uniref:Zn(2)-C6 fungal-type domain-containing protein n=1 Tax=Rhizodiscina lignyota TaxID=1504668 RepID=A0A9P4IF79_9PEZI|nr:hypothetical protein NA57DRAFT_40833 [Rhizodiscina lignyota]
MIPDAEDVSPSPSSHGEEEDDDMAMEQSNDGRGSSEPSNAHANGNGQTKSSSAKDPQRPRRKKARRACAACQRAHLTCGDERPCNRCIKRGIEASCQDGVRKKAKYLQDVAAENLMPGVGGPFTSSNGNTYNHNAATVTVPQSTNYYPTAAQPTSNFEMFGTSNQTPMPPPPLSSNGSFTNQQSPTSPSFQSIASQQSPSAQGMAPIPTSSQPGMSQLAQQFAFDPADPALFNFDISGFNFGNQFGAMEFGMLGHIAGGAADSPTNENHLVGAMQMPANYGGPINSASTFADGSNGGIMFNQDPMISSEWQRHNSMSSQFNPVNDGPGRTDSVSSNAYAIGAGPGTAQKKRKRDYDAIYDGVKAPYSYTEGFHSLQAFLTKYYSPDKKLRIAKALATYRPTLINTYGAMSERDLIFAEQGFQRALCEMEHDILPLTGTPAIILRRTGEVAYITKEFCYMTGWPRDVLLGKAPNLNINLGASTGNHTGASTRGAVNTPRLSTLDGDSANAKAAKPRPVLIAELLDHESVVQFWEDCARHAYVDPAGREYRPCKLIKYRTKDMDSAEDANGGGADGTNGAEGPVKKHIKKEHDHDHIKREEEMLALGKNEGTVNSMMTWNIKRDVFDAPMMFTLLVSRDPFMTV